MVDHDKVNVTSRRRKSVNQGGQLLNQRRLLRDEIKEKGFTGKGDVYLEFLGHKLVVKQDEEGNGTIDAEDIPYVKGGSSLMDVVGMLLGLKSRYSPCFTNALPC